jgi:hypothetical protein
MPENEIIRRRSRLPLDVTQAAAEVSRLVHEAYDLNLPVEPGVRDGRNALVRRAVLLEEVLPSLNGERPRHLAGAVALPVESQPGSRHNRGR